MYIVCFGFRGDKFAKIQADRYDTVSENETDDEGRTYETNRTLNFYANDKVVASFEDWVFVGINSNVTILTEKNE